MTDPDPVSAPLTVVLLGRDRDRRQSGRRRCRAFHGSARQGRDHLTLHAGDPFLMPSRTPHNALDIGPGTGHMLSTYIVEAGQPLVTFVAGPPASP